MTDIVNWTELINKVSNQSDKVFSKLLTKINQAIRSYQKVNEQFDPSSVQKNHLEIFSIYKLTYEQLLVESDATDIFVETPSLTSRATIIFNIIGTGKWIKFHSGNSQRIFFFDEEKTMISDKALADFLNKIEDIRSGYKYFGEQPLIYYKFKSLPLEDVVNYLKNFGIISLEFDQPTPKIIHDCDRNKVLLDQSMMLTLCSNLSFGLCESFYRSPEDKSKEIMLKNKAELDAFLVDKIILVNENVYEQTKFKIEKMGGLLEKNRFDELCKKIIAVPEEHNPRFYYLKDIELACVSVAEREYAIIVTGNHRMCNKIDTYYQEIPYKLFYGAQLVETNYE